MSVMHWDSAWHTEGIIQVFATVVKIPVQLLPPVGPLLKPKSSLLELQIGLLISPCYLLLKKGIFPAEGWPLPSYSLSQFARVVPFTWHTWPSKVCSGLFF
jgi:hypothetical protein